MVFLCFFGEYPKKIGKNEESVHATYVCKRNDKEKEEALERNARKEACRVRAPIGRTRQGEIG